MQAITGTVLFVMVLLFAVAVSLKKTEGETGFERFLLFPFYFLAKVLGCYLVLAIVGGVLWVIAWIGIVLREILQWIVGAILYPLHWLF